MRPEAVLDENELEETQKKVRREMEELKKKRTDAMRRRAAVQLGEQRRHQQSCENEKEQEEWRTARRNAEQKKQEVTATAAKRHFHEAEASRQAAQERIDALSEREAVELQKRWHEQEVRMAEASALITQKQQERAKAEDRMCKARVELEQKRELARSMAVAEYEDAREEGEREAEQRAADFVDEKRAAAAKRIEEYGKRREEALSKKYAAASEYDQQMQEQYEQRVERDAIVDQQMRERMEQPHSNLEKHQRDLKRQEAAPFEVQRLEMMRERRFEAERIASDEIVQENRERAVERHAKWVASRHNARFAVVKRIEAAQREKMSRTEEHAASVRKYEESVQKLEAKKQIRDRIVKQEREEFHKNQSLMMAAVHKSQVGAEVITDGALDTVISGAKAKKKPGR